MAQEKKTYSVNIDMQWCYEVQTTAKNKSEAKKKIWARFKKSCPKRYFDIMVDEI